MLMAMLKRTLSGLCLCLTACAPPEIPETTESGDDGEPSITIIFPESSQEIVYCPTFIVSVDVENFTLTDIVDGAGATEGEGHWHLLDSADYIIASSKEYVFVPSSKALSPGTHSLVATLAYNDHQLVDPPVAWSVEIVVGDTQSDGVTPCIGSGGSSSAGGDTGSDTGMDY